MGSARHLLLESAQLHAVQALVRALGALGVMVAGCTSPSGAQVSVEQCLASCTGISDDGGACLSWAALASSQCRQRFSAAQACCGPGDHAECQLARAVPSGLPCVCRGSDQYGAYVLQGSACRPR